MPRRIEQEEAIAGVEKARKYAEEHRKYARLLYKTLLRDVRAFNISGHYLEIGAGPGFLAIMIAEDNPNVSLTLVDISLDMAAVANEYIRKRNLQDRIRYLVADANDEAVMRGLDKFDLVYSVFSLHHWRDPVKCINNLWNAVRDEGMLYIYDFKRVWWLSCLPLKSGEITSIRASYTPVEIKSTFEKLGILDYKIKVPFPFFLQSIIACKLPSQSGASTPCALHRLGVHLSKIPDRQVTLVHLVQLGSLLPYLLLSEGQPHRIELRISGLRSYDS